VTAKRIEGHDAPGVRAYRVVADGPAWKILAQSVHDPYVWVAAPAGSFATRGAAVDQIDRWHAAQITAMGL
jgi:hypothetical protein